MRTEITSRNLTTILEFCFNSYGYHIYWQEYRMCFVISLGSWLRHYATSRKVAGSNPDEVIEFFFNLPNPSNSTGPGVDSASTRNEYQDYSWNVLGDKGPLSS
jgi:hypothetical protein